MANEKIASFVIKFDGDASDLEKVFGGLVSSVDRTVATIQRAADKVDLFRAISDNLPKVQTALDSAKAKVVEYSVAIEKAQAAGGKAPKELIDGLKQAENAAAAATKELARQQQQLATLDAQLARAGVNTKNLAAEQVRLAEASRAAAIAAEQQAAKQTLGLVTLKDTEAQAAKLRAAFDTLKASGTLSASEIAIAQSRLTASLKELDGTVTKAGGGLKSLGADLKATFTALGGPLLAAVGGVAAVTAALTSAIAAAKEYRNTLAEASASSDRTKESASALGAEAQKLATTLGLNVNESVKSLFALLRAGVPEDNALEVLRVSAEGAKASLSDVGTGVKAAKLFLNDAKIPADQLGHAFDVLKVTVGGSKEGFETFANSAGGLLNVAKASNIGLEDLLGTLRAMTKAGLDTEESISALQKIILALATPEARQQLANYGITATDLQGIFTQLSEKGARLQDVLDLTGISRKSASAVAALINDQSRLKDSFDRVAASGGIVQQVNAKLYDTPREISERFHATLDVTKQKLGELAGASGRATTLVTYLLDKFNALAAQAQIVDDFEARKQQALDHTGEALLRQAAAALGLTAEQERAGKAADEYAQKENAAARATEDLSAKLDEQRTKLQTAAADLLKQAQALEALTTEQVKAVEEGAQRQITAIELAAGARRRQTDADRQALEQARVAAGVILQLGQQEITVVQNVAAARAQAGITAKEAAALTLAAQQEAVDKEIAIVTDKVAKIKAIEDAAQLARTKAAGSSQLELQKAADEEIGARTKSTQAILALYLNLGKNLEKIQKDSNDKVNTLDAERISFTQQIAQKLQAIRDAGLTDSERYAQTVRDIDKATSDARRALDEGDFKSGKEFTDRSIQLAESLGKVEDSEGRIVVSSLEAQQQKTRAIITARDQYTAALKESGEAAKTGADKAQAELDKIRPVIEQLSKQLDDFRAKLAENIDKKVRIDLDGVEQAQDIIRELVKPQTKVITIRTVRQGESAPNDSTPTSPLDSGIPFSRGGFVPPWKAYAAGGPVFNRPTWSKVPGIGDRDTQPALLQEGAFVVRKAASQFYGDSAMARLANVARGYSGGGFVGFGTGSGLQVGGGGSVSQTAADLKDFFRKGDKNLTPDEINKLGQYLTSLPQSEQDRLQRDISLGGTDAIIAQTEIADGAATQARGAPVNLAPADVSPTPSATEATTYGRYVESHLKFGGIMHLIKTSLGNDIRQVERRPNDAGLIQELIRTARAAAANNWLEVVYGKTVFGGTNTSFKNLKDWYEFVAEHQTQGPVGPFHGVDFRNIKFGFAGGGPVGGDVVPAMLTPGEWVVPAPRARELGSNFLHALNQKMLAPIPRFATGGPVPGASIPDRGTTSVGGTTINVTINAAGGDPSDSRFIRKITDGIREQLRRAGQTTL